MGFRNGSEVVIGKKYFITQRYCEWYLYQIGYESSLKPGEIVEVEKTINLWVYFDTFALPYSLLCLLSEKIDFVDDYYPPM